MIERPTQWPDGRKLGGENGYPPEWYAWAEEQEIKFVAREMLRAVPDNRRAIHASWLKSFPHATPERIKDVWDEVVSEFKRNRQGNKTQQLRNNATKTQQQRNGRQ